MRSLLWLALAMTALGVSACGTKGKLKTPAQIEAQQAKKERSEAKKQKEERENSDSAPAAEREETR